MYRDYFLKFANKEEFDQCRVLLETNDYYATMCFSDVIGKIENVDGYHVNIRTFLSVELPNEWLNKAINPTTPLRRFAGDAETYVPEKEVIQ